MRGLEHAFSPPSVTITPGGTLTWIMVDDEHDVTRVRAAPPGGNIPKTDEGVSVTRTFPTAGTYTCRCARHENHNETVTVLVQGGSSAAVFTSVSVAPGSAEICDNVQHSSTSDAIEGWDSGLISATTPYERTFDRAVRFPYHCGPHPSMTATIIVE